MNYGIGTPLSYQNVLLLDHADMLTLLPRLVPNPRQPETLKEGVNNTHQFCHLQGGQVMIPYICPGSTEMHPFRNEQGEACYLADGEAHQRQDVRMRQF